MATCCVFPEHGDCQFEYCQPIRASEVNSSGRGRYDSAGCRLNRHGPCKWEGNVFAGQISDDVKQATTRVCFEMSVPDSVDLFLQFNEAIVFQ